MVDGVQLQNNHVVHSHKKCWRLNVSAFLATQPRHLGLFEILDVASIVHHQKEATHSALYDNDQLSSLALEKNLQPEYKYAQHVSFVTCFSSRRLISRFRCGCHELDVDTRRFRSQQLAREDGSVMCPDLHLSRMCITFCLNAQRILTSEAHLQLCFKGVHHTQQLLSSMATIPP